jgi:hypothetical protein
MNSKDIEKELESAHQELELKEKNLLDLKATFIGEVRHLLPNHIERTISEIISANASRVEAISTDELRKMKSALAQQKDQAIEKGISALQSADWLWRSTSGVHTERDPIDILGLNEGGPIWQSLQSYSKDLEATFKSFGFEVEERLYTASRSRFLIDFPRAYHQKKERLQEINEAIGKAHEEYVAAKGKISSLEAQLKRTLAREKFEAA